MLPTFPMNELRIDSPHRTTMRNPPTSSTEEEVTTTSKTTTVRRRMDVVTKANPEPEATPTASEVATVQQGNAVEAESRLDTSR